MTKPKNKSIEELIRQADEKTSSLRMFSQILGSRPSDDDIEWRARMDRINARLTALEEALDKRDKETS